MLELKSKNLFTGKSDRLYPIHRIFEFYDILGKNICVFHNRHKQYNGFNNLSTDSLNLSKDLVNNLFRLDIIVVDFSFVNLTNVISVYDIIREITNIPIIFIIDWKHIEFLKLDWFETAYLLEKKINFSAQFVDSLDEYLVKDLKNEWSSNLQELKKQYIRDKKLRDLFGED